MSAEAQVSAACTPPNQLGVVFTLDDSGSMHGSSGSDPDELRGEATKLGLDLLPDGSVAAAVTFGDGADAVLPSPSLLDDNSRSVLKGAVDSSLTDQGGTDYDEAFLETKRQLDAMPASVDRKAVIFLSDGQPTSDNGRDGPIADAGIPIFTVGLGSADENVLTGISDRSNGAYFKLDTAADAQQIFSDVLARVACAVPQIQTVDTLAAGASKAYPFDVGVDDIRFEGGVSWASGDVSVSLVRSDKTTLDAGHVNAFERFVSGQTYAQFAVENPRPGAWSVVITNHGTTQEVRVGVRLFQRNDHIDSGIPLDTSPGCVNNTTVGPISLRATCLQTQPDGTLQSSARVRVGGIDLVPEAGAATAGKIIINPRALTISTEGAIAVYIGPYRVWAQTIRWSAKLPSLTIDVAPGSVIRGLEIGGSLKATWIPGGATVVAHLSLGKSFSSVTGDATLNATMDRGVELNKLHLGLQSTQLRLFGKLALKSAGIDYSSATGVWSGNAKVGVPAGPTVEAVLQIKDGQFKALDLEVANLNAPIGNSGMFLNALRAGVQVNPFGLRGGITATAGPSVRLLGNSLSAASIAGDVLYLDASPSLWEAKGELKIIGAPLADGKLQYRAGQQVSVEGRGRIGIDNVYIDGELKGSISSSSEFMYSETGEARVFGVGGKGSALINQRGVGICSRSSVSGFGKTFTVETGATYRYGDRFPHASGCGFEELKNGQSRSGAAAAAATNGSIRLPRAGSYLVVLTGKSGPPVLQATLGNEAPVTTSATEPVVGPGFIAMPHPMARQQIVAIHVSAAAVLRLSGGAVQSQRVLVRAPSPRISAVVRRAATPGMRTLSYRLTGLGESAVQFVESDGGTVDRPLGKRTRRARGTIEFAPVPGRGGTRTIYAVLTNDGIPTKRLRIAAFKRSGTPRPVVKRQFKAKRTATYTDVFVKQVPNAAEYQVRLRLVDGRVLLRASRRSGQFRFPVSKAGRAYVRVIGVTGLRSRERSIPVK